MSTRSVIARRMGDGWEGVYHHSDGYPTGLGCYLFRLIRHEYDGDAEAFLRWAIDEHDSGWSHIFPAQVYGAEGHSSDSEAPQCYCHGYFAERDGVSPGDRGGWQTSEEHGFDVEWAYVLDPHTRKMAVLKHDMPACPDYKELSSTISSTRKEEPCIRLAGVVDLREPEPDWLELEGGQHLENGLASWVDRYYPPITERSE